MLQKGFPQSLEVIFIFFLFILSNILTFINVFWLVPSLVLSTSIFWLIFAALSVWILKKHNLLSVLFKNFKRNWIILPFLIFSGFSIFWSISWEISLYRWLILISTLITGAYIGMRNNSKEVLLLLSMFGLWILALSTILVIFMPSIGVMNYYIIQGAWKGVYWHKNHMGLIATFINILFLINIIDSYKSKGQHKLFWGFLYLFSLFFIYQSDSVAAYISTIFLHGVILLALIWMKFKKYFRRSHFIILLVVLIIASIILSTNLDLIFGIFDRSTSLTGRIPMWSYLFNTYFNKRPVLGYGFNAFWYISAHREAMQQAAGYPDSIIIADNGFIDILMNTGYVGLFLFLLFYIGIWLRSIKRAIKASNIIGFFPAILMAYTLIANVSWSLIFENENFFMLIMISVLFNISNLNIKS